MRMARQRELQHGFRHMCESCLIRVFGYASTSVWGPSNHHVPALRAALARRNAAWLNTLQEAGAHVAPTRRKVRVECEPYWRHSHAGRKPKQSGDTFVFRVGAGWAEKLRECAKDQLKERRGEFIDGAILSFGDKNSQIPKHDRRRQS